MGKINRRELLGGIAGSAAGLSLVGCEGRSTAVKGQLKKYPNEHFYTADGKFDAGAAKNAYYEMMRYYDYPIVPRLRGDDFWTLDFGLGKFTEVGMAGIFWVNNKEHNYFGHEIYLLPGQMIPEHQHVATVDAAPKLEAWQVRYGWVYVYGEGEPTVGVEQRIPPSHKEYAVARTEKKLNPGEVGMLGRAEEKHWMLAGPQGAIVTEYATYHDGKALRFSHPKVTF